MFNFSILKNRSHLLKKERLAIVLLLSSMATVYAQPLAKMEVETLLKSNKSWDGTSYSHYPNGKPELSILKITIPPRTAIKWHKHPMPNAGYLLSGEITLEKEGSSEKIRVTQGQALAETVNILHRGVTGEEPAVLIVFYAGTEGMPLTQYE